MSIHRLRPYKSDAFSGLKIVFGLQNHHNSIFREIFMTRAQILKFRFFHNPLVKGSKWGIQEKTCHWSYFSGSKFFGQLQNKNLGQQRLPLDQRLILELAPYFDYPKIIEHDLINQLSQNLCLNCILELFLSDRPTLISVFFIVHNMK